MEVPPADLAEFVNNLPSGWVREMGIKILEASPEQVTCEWHVSEKHHQGYGIVHGGVHSGYMIAQYGAAALASELRTQAVPASVESIPTSGLQEDYNSMAAGSALKARRAVGLEGPQPSEVSAAPA